jgi:hypothetical protein
VYGTAWQVEGNQVLVTSRGEIPPDSHASLVWELDGDDPNRPEVVRADVVVRNARRDGESLPGTHHYVVELRAMSHRDQHLLGRWLESRQDASEGKPEHSTDMVFRDLRTDRRIVVDERPTDQFVQPRGLAVAAQRQRPRPASISKATTRRTRSAHAEITVSVAGDRVHLSWLTWEDLEADWVAMLSYGTLYVPGNAVAVGSSCVIIARLPDGRKALLSGRAVARVRRVTCIELSMGEQTRVLFTRRFAMARVQVPR